MPKQTGTNVVAARKCANMLLKGRTIHIETYSKCAGTIVILARTWQNCFYCGDSVRANQPCRVPVWTSFAVKWFAASSAGVKRS